MARDIERGWIHIPLDELHPAAWNYKDDDAEQAQKLLGNVRRNGQVQNIIVRWDLERDRWEVANGNHRLPVFADETAQRDHPQLCTPMCFSLGAVSQQEAARLAIETNELEFPVNDFRLAQVVGGLLEEFPLEELTATMPYTAEELHDYENMLDFDWSQFESAPKAHSETTDYVIRARVDKDTFEQWAEYRSFLETEDEAEVVRALLSLVQAAEVAADA
ncbi:MAG: ParB N-terminal domain-containing protein [Candidatus Latescibacteria bacterium]|jgi:hypothetical protein|nr:ParB N-terminal domain-containing protein [Candidatus Latescibacterota bacterium]